MLRLKQQLKRKLNPPTGGQKNAARVAVLGIGSELRGDDAAGLLVLDHLRRKLSQQKKTGRSPKLRLFNGGTAPENLTGEIRRFNPSHLIMIDAVELGKRPGTMELLDLKKIENTAFLTHKLPIKLMLDYLAAEMTFTTVFIGMQPHSLEFEGKISKAVARSCGRLAEMLSLAILTTDF